MFGPQRCRLLQVIFAAKMAFPATDWERMIARSPRRWGASAFTPGAARA